MGLMQFTDKMLVGVAEVDAQHRRLVDIINHLYGIALRRETVSSVEEVLAELTDYLEEHFTFEERLFVQHGYHGGTGHEAAHNVFRRRIAAFEARRDKNLIVALDLLHFLKQWLTDHIMGEDRRACAFLNSRGIF